MKKILIIEDDQFSADLYKEILEAEGYQIACVNDGKNGYEAMKIGGYDLVLLDVILPKIDGFEILKKLKKEGFLKRNKYIFLLTNLSQETSSKEKKNLKVNEYLIKSSLTPDQLVEKVKKYLK